jgi:AGZA family xanthine/uracil permease-like MFS transporter
MAVAGFLLIVTLDRLRVRGAILIGIVAVTVLSFFFGGNSFQGLVISPRPRSRRPCSSWTCRARCRVGILNVVLVFFLVELFDATGTLMGVASRAGLLVEGKMERLNKALLADSAPSSPAPPSAPRAPPPISKARPACRPAAAPA